METRTMPGVRPGLPQLLLAQLSMRRGRRMAAQGFGAAQAGGVDGDPQPIQEPLTRLPSAGQVDAQHPARHPVAEDRAARARAVGASAGPGRGWPRRRRLPPAPQATANAFAEWRSMRSASVFRPRSARKASSGAALPPALITISAGRRDALGTAQDRATGDVRVAADVLGGRVHDHVGAERQRVGEVRRGEGVVDRDRSRRGGAPSRPGPRCRTWRWSGC